LLKRSYYYSEGLHDGHQLENSQFFHFSVQPPPEIFAQESRMCFHSYQHKLITLSNQPTKVLLALNGGIAKPATCEASEVLGEFNVVFEEGNSYVFFCFFLFFFFFFFDLICFSVSFHFMCEFCLLFLFFFWF
jgi:hypothetical protein